MYINQFYCFSIERILMKIISFFSSTTQLIEFVNNDKNEFKWNKLKKKQSFHVALAPMYMMYVKIANLFTTFTKQFIIAPEEKILDHQKKWMFWIETYYYKFHQYLNHGCNKLMIHPWINSMNEFLYFISITKTKTTTKSFINFVN
mgnify:CR=1 FL=1